MRSPVPACLLCVLLTLSACNEDRIAKLEQQNKDLQAQLQKQRQTADLESQSRCAKDSREWFTREYPGDANTTLLTYENHYSPKLSKCFISVSWNYTLGPKTTSVQKLTSIYDVYENTSVAEYSELHMWINGKSEAQMATCEVQHVKCSSSDEFTRRIAAFQ